MDLKKLKSKSVRDLTAIFENCSNGAKQTSTERNKPYNSLYGSHDSLYRSENNSHVLKRSSRIYNASCEHLNMVEKPCQSKELIKGDIEHCNSQEPDRQSKETEKNICLNNKLINKVVNYSELSETVSTDLNKMEESDVTDKEEIPNKTPEAAESTEILMKTQESYQIDKVFENCYQNNEAVNTKPINNFNHELRNRISKEVGEMYETLKNQCDSIMLLKQMDKNVQDLGQIIKKEVDEILQDYWTKFKLFNLNGLVDLRKTINIEIDDLVSEYKCDEINDVDMFEQIMDGNFSDENLVQDNDSMVIEIDELFINDRNNNEVEQDENNKECTRTSMKSNIITELLETEKKYVADLRKVVTNFMPAFEHKQDYETIFGNIKVLYEKQELFFQDLCRTDYDVKEIATVIKKHEDLFNEYPKYMKNYYYGIRILPNYKVLIREIMHKFYEKLDLNAYLIAPVQRLAKYPLLLENLKSQLVEKDTSVNALEGALNLIKTCLTRGNNEVAIDSPIISLPYDIDHGKFLLKDDFNVTIRFSKEPYKRTIFLFEKQLIFTKKNSQGMYMYKNHINFESIKPSNEKDNKIKVQDYTLEHSKLEVMALWKKSIHEILWRQLEDLKEKKKQNMQSNTLDEEKKDAGTINNLKNCFKENIDINCDDASIVIISKDNTEKRTDSFIEKKSTIKDKKSQLVTPPIIKKESYDKQETRIHHSSSKIADSPVRKKIAKKDVQSSLQMYTISR